jgi:hypothetical protein
MIIERTDKFLHTAVEIVEVNAFINVDSRWVALRLALKESVQGNRDVTHNLISNNIDNFVAAALSSLFISWATNVEVLSRTHHQRFDSESLSGLHAAFVSGQWMVAIGTDQVIQPLLSVTDYVVEREDWDASPLAIVCKGTLSTQLRADIQRLTTQVRNSGRVSRLVEDIINTYPEVEAVCSFIDRDVPLYFAAKRTEISIHLAERAAAAIMNTSCVITPI